MKVLASSAVYFAMVFGAGFALGTVRVMALVPKLGVRAAELIELPMMVVVAYVAARWVNRRHLAVRDHRSRLMVGITAFLLLVAAEVILGVALLGRTLKDVLVNRDAVSGTAYYLSLCAFALMPWYVGLTPQTHSRDASRLPVR